MELTQLQTKVDEWILSTGVKYFNPMTNLGILMEEVGELSRIMVRRYGNKAKRNQIKVKI